MAGTKRKHGQDSPNEVYSNKSRGNPTVEPRVDPTYGQRSALPGLDQEVVGDDELSYGDDQDALSYLRAVRHEAHGIPNLLVAPQDPSDNSRYIYEDGTSDFRGWYEDGAYCSAPQPTPNISSNVEDKKVAEGKDAQLAYFDSILSRYENLRTQLQQPPPLEALEKLDADHPTHLGKLNTEVARWWKWKMRKVDPVPTQIASMDKSTVLRLLGLLTTGTLLKRGSEVEISVSRWAWSLLARLPGRGELTSEEIGVVRELGKKAVLVGMGLKEENEWEEGIEEVEAGFDEEHYEGDMAVVNEEEILLDNDEDLDNIELEPIALEDRTSKQANQIGPQLPTPPNGLRGGDSDGNEGAIEENITASDDLAAAKSRILESLNNIAAEDIVEEGEAEIGQEALEKKSAAKWNTHATVDMIITVAGEIYGQRDLLEFRSSWERVE